MFSQIKNNNFIKILLILLILIISIAFLYKPHFKIKLGGYDNIELYKEVQEKDSLKKIINYKYFSKGGSPPSAYFVPVILLVWRHMVIHYNKNPYPYHMLCTLIHIINTIIVFFLLKRFIKNNFFSFAAALSFAIYYLNFKTVEWICAGIAVGLATFFILFTLFLAIKYFQTKNKFTPLNKKYLMGFLYFSSLLTFFLGIFTKEYVIFTIPILLAYYFIIQRKRVLKFVKTDLLFLPYFILSLPIILITLTRLNESAVVTRWGGFNFGIHMFYRFIDFVSYLITIVPASFVINMAVGMFVLLLLPLLIYRGLKDKNLLFLTVWLVLSITIFIYSNFRDIYSLGRYLYLPSVAWFGLLYYIIANIKNIKIKLISSFCLINYTVILNLLLILTKK